MTTDKLSERVAAIEKIDATSRPQLAEAKAEPSAEAVELLRRAAEYIGEGGHGDNCYVSRQYEGDPGDQCNCGKESMCDAIDWFLVALDSRKEREGGLGGAAK